MPPNTLRVHTEHVLVKSVDTKVIWEVASEITCARCWRIFPSLLVLAYLVKVEISSVTIYLLEIRPVSGSGNSSLREGHSNNNTCGRGFLFQHLKTFDIALIFVPSKSMP
ncbi:hypothetical protein TNCV_4187931 [Trichonephila clavipes]|nr:hypothetical protein TNCV_4187931 [Trichonephila clavipes]